jgi:hypothetical protein
MNCEQAVLLVMLASVSIVEGPGSGSTKSERAKNISVCCPTVLDATFGDVKEYETAQAPIFCPERHMLVPPATDPDSQFYLWLVFYALSATVLLVVLMKVQLNLSVSFRGIS